MTKDTSEYFSDKLNKTITQRDARKWVIRYIIRHGK